MPNRAAIRRLVMRRRVTAATGVDAATTAWVNAVVGAGGSVSANQTTYVDTLIKAYKSAGVWTLLDREWLYASENATQASIDIVNLSTHALGGAPAPAFTANRGYAGGSGTEYIDTNYTPGTNFTLNSLSFGAYVFAPSASAFNTAVMGFFPTYTYFKAGGTNIEFDADEASFFTVANPSGFSAGNFIITRTSTTAVLLYRNTGTALSTQSAAANAVPTGNIFVLAANSGGSPTQFFNGTVASAFFGGALDPTKAQAKNSALNAYMTSVGANVY